VAAATASCAAGDRGASGSAVVGGSAKEPTEVAFELTDIAPAYERAASFRVVDATPCPPTCRDEQGCFWLHG
jgi:hypothetical protein